MKTVVSTLVAFLVLAVSLQAASDFKLQVINNIADPAAGTFTIRINGKDFYKDMGFRKASPLSTVKLPATMVISSTNPAYADMVREYSLEQYEGGTVLLTLQGVADPTQFSTPDARDISYLAHEFALLPDAVQPTKVNVTVLHSATDLPKLDLRVVNENPLVTDLDYNQTSFFTAALPAKDYTLTLHPMGDFETTWKTVSADFSQDMGKHIYIMPSGYLDPAANQNGPALELIGISTSGTVVVFPPAGEVAMAKLQLINASADPAAESVDIYVNGTKVADNLGFRSASAFMDVPADETLSIVIAEPNSNGFDDKVLATLSADDLDENSWGVMVLHGVISAAGFAVNPNGEPITMKIYPIGNPMMRATNPSTIEVLSFNGITDSAPIDIMQRDEEAFASTMGYGRGTDAYFAMQPGNYTLDITPATANDIILKSFTANMTPLTGQAVILIAGGFMNPAQNKDGMAIGLFAVSTNGTVTVFEEITVGVEDEQALRSSLAISPNPAGETAHVSFELPVSAPVVLSVHDVAGRVVKTIDRGTVPAGHLNIAVDTRDLTAGVYMVTLEVAGHRISRSLNVVK